MFCRAARCAGKKNRSRLRGVQPRFTRDSDFSENRFLIGDFSILHSVLVFAPHWSPSAQEDNGINSWATEVSALNPSAVCEPDAESPGTFHNFLEPSFEI